MKHSDAVDAKFNALLNVARAEFADKQKAFGAEIAHATRWQIEEADGTLTFSGDGHEPLVYAITPIGTWLSAQQDFAWAWGNDVFPDAARQRCAALKELGELSGHPMFEHATFHAHAQDVGDLCILAIHHLGAHAQFRTTDEPRCYYALDATSPRRIRRSRTTRADTASGTAPSDPSVRAAP